MNDGLSSDEQPIKKSPFYLRIWFWWIFLTLFYLAGFVLKISPKLVASIGLFVPFGPFNFGALYGIVTGFISSRHAIIRGSTVVVATAILIFGGERFLRKFNLLWFVKILLNLLILFLLTFLVDLLFWYPDCFWPSWQMFIKGPYDAVCWG